ncbi:hypothetical protein F4804DRAFT_352715 [Jackrogersella minutella]|nr:hypothetical protein F4804DRAFT_352715 [Jackrogersella minutella]
MSSNPVDVQVVPRRTQTGSQAHQRYSLTSAQAESTEKLGPIQPTQAEQDDPSVKIQPSAGIAARDEPRNTADENPRDQATQSNPAVMGVRWFLVVVAILINTFVYAIDNTIVAVIQPAIVQRFGDLADLLWVSVGPLTTPALLENCVSQSLFVDTLLHAAGFLANCSTSASDVCICTKIDCINLWINAVDYTESFRLYTEISSSQKAVVGNPFAYDAAGKLVGSIQGITFHRLGKEAFTRSLQTGIRDISSMKSSGANSIGLTPVIQSEIGIAHVNDVDKAKMAEIGSDTYQDLQHIGLDSLMAFELLDSLGSQLGLEIPHAEFESCQTPNDIARLAESIKQPPVQRNGDKQASKSLSLIRRGPDRLHPLYMVHDGSDLCSMYSGISSLGKILFGISCDEKSQFRTINDMATAYAGLVGSSKPFILGDK